MTSIVIHYKELALKGKNRPWFIQLLVRNLKTALAGLHVASVRSSMGRIELELRPDSPWEEVRERLSRIFGIANFSYANHGPHDFEALAVGDPGRPRRHHARVVPRVGDAVRQAAAVHVAAGRARDRRA